MPAERSSKAPRKSAVGGKPCVVCNKIILRDMKRHLLSHRAPEDRPLKCPHEPCDQRFNQKSHLIVHERKWHDGTRPILCPHFWVDEDGVQSQCAATFYEGASFLDHRKSSHGYEPKVKNQESKVMLCSRAEQEAIRQLYDRLLREQKQKIAERSAAVCQPPITHDGVASATTAPSLFDTAANSEAAEGSSQGPSTISESTSAPVTPSSVLSLATSPDIYDVFHGPGEAEMLLPSNMSLSQGDFGDLPPPPDQPAVNNEWEVDAELISAFNAYADSVMEPTGMDASVHEVPQTQPGPSHLQFPDMSAPLVAPPPLVDTQKIQFEWETGPYGMAPWLQQQDATSSSAERTPQAQDLKAPSNSFDFGYL
ncbi:hypothetical protein C2E23DRAFT_325803 [Lenzites betulinus]|nr:hypothetical protein C2E23DRAFT_325803 [Lenzites betulinus]